MGKEDAQKYSDGGSSSSQEVTWTHPAGYLVKLYVGGSVSQLQGSSFGYKSMVLSVVRNPPGP